MNPNELAFWLDWYDTLDAALARGEGAVVAHHDPATGVYHKADERLLSSLQEIRELFLRAGAVNVFYPREAEGTQVWPANWKDVERAGPLTRLVEEPAYLAQDQGFRCNDPDAPAGVSRLIDLLEVQQFCRAISEKAARQCGAWPRIVPGLLEDGFEKTLREALPAFDLLREANVDRVLADLGLPREIMSPFLPYVERDLSLGRLVRDASPTEDAAAPAESRDGIDGEEHPIPEA